jgi:hypothetical protein
MSKKDEVYDFGFSAVDEDELILPLLNNLMKNPEKVYIKWPNREKIVKDQINKIIAITRSET